MDGLRRLLIFVTLLKVASCQVLPGDDIVEDDDVGSWAVSNCILVKMKGQFEIHPDSKDTNTTVTVNIPVDAKVSNLSSCQATNTSQTLILTWEEKENTTENILSRNFTVTFSVNSTASPAKYGVSKISGVYELKTYNETDPEQNTTTLVKDYISFTTFKMNPWEFSVQQNKTYLCSDLGTKSMEAELHKSNEKGGDPGERLANATFTATSVQFNAFRPTTIPDHVFQTASDCNYRPNDVVPIIVGCALAGMVVMVLIAYMVGRSRSRARGYMSV